MDTVVLTPSKKALKQNKVGTVVKMKKLSYEAECALGDCLSQEDAKSFRSIRDKVGIIVRIDSVNHEGYWYTIAFPNLSPAENQKFGSVSWNNSDFTVLPLSSLIPENR